MQINNLTNVTAIINGAAFIVGPMNQDRGLDPWVDLILAAHNIVRIPSTVAANNHFGGNPLHHCQ